MSAPSDNTVEEQLNNTILDWNSPTMLISMKKDDIYPRLIRLIHSLTTQARQDELKREKHHFRNKISFYSNELDDYIDERVNELGAVGAKPPTHSKRPPEGRTE